MHGVDVQSGVVGVEIWAGLNFFTAGIEREGGSESALDSGRHCTGQMLVEQNHFLCAGEEAGITTVLTRTPVKQQQELW